ncbi:hypothetical protein LV779_11885 [Streptomyces thinghirensis]|nr:hypothetical protein [Streptomyces thinghirensis]
MDGIEDGSPSVVPQPADGVNPRPGRSPSRHARVDWTAPALRPTAVVRGCTPAPGALDHVPGASGSKLAGNCLAPDRIGPRPGAACRRQEHVHARHLLPAAVELLWVQAQGKKPMRAADWARGVRITEAESRSAADLRLRSTVSPARRTAGERTSSRTLRAPLRERAACRPGSR